MWEFSNQSSPADTHQSGFAVGKWNANVTDVERKFLSPDVDLEWDNIYERLSYLQEATHSIYDTNAQRRSTGKHTCSSLRKVFWEIYRKYVPLQSECVCLLRVDLLARIFVKIDIYI